MGRFITTDKRKAQFCVNLYQDQADEIIKRATAERRSPSEWLFLLISDYLKEGAK